MAATHTSKALEGSRDDTRSSSSSERPEPSPDKLKKLDVESQSQKAAQSDSESNDIGRQIELEAGNSIKYRTCSWEKVCLPSRHLSMNQRRSHADHVLLDGGPAILRVHLLGYHVIPLVLFRPGFSSRLDSDRGHCGHRALYLAHHLVCASSFYNFG